MNSSVSATLLSLLLLSLLLRTVCANGTYNAGHANYMGLVLVQVFFCVLCFVPKPNYFRVNLETNTKAFDEPHGSICIYTRKYMFFYSFRVPREYRELVFCVFEGKKKCDGTLLFYKWAQKIYSAYGCLLYPTNAPSSLVDGRWLGLPWRAGCGVIKLFSSLPFEGDPHE